MTATPGARQRERCGRTADLFAGMALAELEEKLSPRSRAVLALLRTRGPVGATTLELANVSGSLALHTLIDQLRKRLPAGWLIKTARRGATGGGRSVFAYVLLEEGAG